MTHLTTNCHLVGAPSTCQHIIKPLVRWVNNELNVTNLNVFRAES